MSKEELREYREQEAAKKEAKMAAKVLNRIAAGSSTVTGREKEYDALQKRVADFLKTSKSSLVFLTGVPGSGKTHVAKKALASLRSSFINCSVLKRPGDVFSLIAKSFDCHETGKCTLSTLRSHLAECPRLHILVIDEIDFLYTKNESVIYNLLELPLIGAPVLLIAISNVLGRLSTRVESRLVGSRIDFKPYSADVLQKIISEASGGRSQLGKVASGLVAKRVASGTGDVRRVFEVMNQSKKGDVESVSKYLDDSQSPLLCTFVQSLPYYYKALFFINTEGPVTVNEWFTRHALFCSKHNLKKLDFASFCEIAGRLAAMGLYSLAGHAARPLFLKEEADQVVARDEALSKLAKARGKRY